MLKPTKWYLAGAMSFVLISLDSYAQESRRETPRQPATQKEAPRFKEGPKAQAGAREISRTPVYNHDAGPDRVVAWKIEYSDGAMRWQEVGGGTRSSSSPNNTQGGAGAAGASNDKTIKSVAPPEWVDYGDAMKQQDQIVKSFRPTITEEQEKVNQLRKEANDASLSMGDKINDVRRRGEANIGEAGANAARRYVPSTFRCSDGNDWENCTNHPEEKAAWLAKGRNAAAQAEAEARQQVQDELAPLEKEKAAARKKYNEAGKKTDELKNKADAAKDLTKRHNNGELWLNPYGGKSPLGDGINYPKSGSTIRMDENAPGRLNPNNKK